MQPDSLLNILFSFCFFSIMGWILEVFYRSFRNQRFTNPGFLKGPYLPLYGTAALMLMVCIPLVYACHIVIKVLCYFLITTGVELVAGFIAYYFFNSRLWDYSDRRFQYQGYICLEFSFYWVLLALAFEYFILPSYQGLLNWLAPEVKWIFTGAVILSVFFTERNKSTKKKRI